MMYELSVLMEKHTHAIVNARFMVKKVSPGKFFGGCVPFSASYLSDNTVIINYDGTVLYTGTFNINSAQVFYFEWTRRCIFEITKKQVGFAEDLREKRGEKFFSHKIAMGNILLVNGMFNEIFDKT